MLYEYHMGIISKFGFDGLIQESTECLIIHLMTEPEEESGNVQLSERAKEYNSIDEITDDGFATTSNVYKAASKYFSQEVAVDKIIIGRKTVS